MKKKGLNLEDIDLGNLDEEAVELIKQYFKDQKEIEKTNKKIFMEEFVKNPERALIKPEER